MNGEAVGRTLRVAGNVNKQGEGAAERCPRPATWAQLPQSITYATRSRCVFVFFLIYLFKPLVSLLRSILSNFYRLFIWFEIIYFKSIVCLKNEYVVLYINVNK